MNSGVPKVVELDDPSHHPRDVRGTTRSGDLPQRLPWTNHRGGRAGRLLSGRRSGARGGHSHQDTDQEPAAGEHDRCRDAEGAASQEVQDHPRTSRSAHPPIPLRRGRGVLLSTQRSRASPSILAQPGGPHCRVLRSQPFQLRATITQSRRRGRTTHRRRRRRGGRRRRAQPGLVTLETRPDLGDEVLRDQPQPRTAGGLPGGAPAALRPRRRARRGRDGDGTHSYLLNTCSTNACSTH